MDSVFQFFSFSVFQFPELFRNISGETEKLKNGIFQGHSGRDFPYVKGILAAPPKATPTRNKGLIRPY